MIYQDLKRAEIEQKVEAAAAEEKERIKKEKEELFQTRREKQIQLRCLEKKLEIAELVSLLFFIHSFVKKKINVFF